MKILDDAVVRATPVGGMIDCLAETFGRGGVTTPLRSVHKLDGGGLYLMPSWSDGAIVVKLATFVAENPARGIPAVQGIVLLIDRDTGSPIAAAEAGIVTNLRTAAVSALASRHLSRTDSRHLLLFGAGSLAPYLVQAHCHARPIERVSIWSRNSAKASELAKTLSEELHDVEFRGVEDVDAVVPMADIISCATNAPQPLLRGDLLTPGTHVDLVGAHSPATREADSAVIARASIWIDTDAARAEAGDLIIPLAEGAIQPDRIVGDLEMLCRETARGRIDDAEITVFKSVGAAIEDLAAMQHIARLTG
ncbi:ornithine cyclodeaminase family protein [Rhizorhabdus wittichii]|uniref:Ornithine cyclodeaminase family protein n=1 Tax=Rhizorhabdus wittichii TaxID=160791 RepID=A0A975CZJ2_9SPHN|nr:ornithine cyclodeaminase family protein [Rhizorhabdus wittichii]QTH20192.1 ornithine cyclodeaminase family protein [Rhizorhabdus wittichii]